VLLALYSGEIWLATPWRISNFKASTDLVEREEKQQVHDNNPARISTSQADPYSAASSQICKHNDFLSWSGPFWGFKEDRSRTVIDPSFNCMLFGRRVRSIEMLLALHALPKPDQNTQFSPLLESAAPHALDKWSAGSHFGVEPPEPLVHVPYHISRLHLMGTGGVTPARETQANRLGSLGGCHIPGKPVASLDLPCLLSPPTRLWSSWTELWHHQELPKKGCSCFRYDSRDRGVMANQERCPTAEAGRRTPQF